MQVAVEKFERIQARPGVALLRVTARVQPATVITDPVTLVIYDRDAVRRVAPLTAAPDQPGLLRLAYSAPIKQLGSRAAIFALELPDGLVVDLPAPVERSNPGASVDAGRYRWLLRARMAERGMFRSTDLAAGLAQRGQALSSTQVYRLVTGRPQRLKLGLLAALCDILECTPNDLIECGPPPAIKASGRADVRRR
jgi:DNA-binding Xre family transcriptional regulator